MNPADRELLLSLRRQQDDLQQTLAALKGQMDAIENRATSDVAAVALPPIPADPPFPPLHPLPIEAGDLPPIPNGSAPVLPAVPSAPAGSLPPVRTAAPLPPPGLPAIPSLPPIPGAPLKPSWQFRVGRLLTRIGAVFGLIFCALVLSSGRVQALLGHAGLLAISGVLGIGAVLFAQGMEDRGSVVTGRVVTAAALGWLYLTAYAATFYDPLKFIGSPVLGGVLLLAWSLYALYLAERRNSPVLGLFVIVLAYIGTALNPVDHFTMAANLLLAAVAAALLVRNTWVAVASFSLIATYFALVRRVVVDDFGDIVLDSSRTLHFLPHAVYLLCAWTLFTIAATWTTSRAFRAGVRRTFVTLNNAGLAGPLALVAYIAGYGAAAAGWCLLGTGLLLLITSRFAERALVDPVDLMAAYAAQGLALVTGGIIVVFTGVTRAVLLLIETFLLGVAGAFSGDRILTISTYVAGAFASLFLIWEMAAHAHHPWLFGVIGALVMLTNAWACRGEVRHSPVARSTTVVSSASFCLLALLLVFTALCTDLNESTLPIGLAVAAVVFTFAIYYVSIFELPAQAQLLLLAALTLVLFPGETGEELPSWSPLFVALVTLLLATWWARQRVTLSGSWTHLLITIYGLALVLLTAQTVRPFLGAQGWMVAAALLSCVFLVYGAFLRVWMLAAAGQLLLALSVYHFLFPPRGGPYPWTWWAAAVPLMVVFVTGRTALEWLRLFREIPDGMRSRLRLVAGGYLVLAAIMLVRWVYAVTPPVDHAAAFLFLGTLIIFLAAQRPSSLGVRCGMILSALGAGSYLGGLHDHALALTTTLMGLSLILFLAQSALACHHGRSVVSRVESWALVLISVALGWTFVSAWAELRLHAPYLTVAWALYAFFLFVFGLGLWERRLRWCALVVLGAAILRVFSVDLWVMTIGYRALTFLVLMVITLTLGYVVVREAEQRESWL